MASPWRDVWSFHAGALTGELVRHTSIPFNVGSSLKVSCVLGLGHGWSHGRRLSVSGWAQDAQREIAGTMSVWAPKRYDKLYLVMMWRSKSGSWWTARREASWRVVDERGDDAEQLGVAQGLALR